MFPCDIADIVTKKDQIGSQEILVLLKNSFKKLKIVVKECPFFDIQFKRTKSYNLVDDLYF